MRHLLPGDAEDTSPQDSPVVALVDRAAAGESEVDSESEDVPFVQAVSALPATTAISALYSTELTAAIVHSRL